MLAYEADTAWNRGIPCILFQSLIQLYLSRSFNYILTYCIKEVIKGRFFLRLYKKVPANQAATAWNRKIPCNCFKTLVQLYLFNLFFYFCLTVSKRVSKVIFLDIIFKVFAYKADTDWNRGIPYIIIKLLIKLYFFCFLLYCST